MKTELAVHELFLNYACGAKCPFCYNPPLTPELLRRDLSTEDAARSLLAGSRSGARILNLHGGEPTLRDDLPHILALARKLRYEQVTLVTNGIRLGDPEYSGLLAKAGATHIRISIHGPDPETHDAIVAVPGAFSKVLRAVENVRARGLPLGVNFVLIRENHRRLARFVEKFCLELGIGDLIVYFPHRRGMMEINAAASGVSYAEVAPSVREAAGALRRAGRLDTLLLANFVPCVLPELSGLMLDWSREHPEAAAMTHPEGGETDIHAMKGSQRAPVRACASCALGSTCLGVEREYTQRHGDAEFAALAEARA